MQLARLPCSSPNPRDCSNSCALNQWCHPTVSSSIVPFSSCLQSYPASGSFPVSQFFTSGGQSIGDSASVLPMNIQDWCPLGLTGFISLQSKSTLVIKSLLQHHSSKPSILWHSSFSFPNITSIHDYWKNHSFVNKVMSLLFNMLSRLVINFFPRIKCLLIWWLQSPLQWLWSPQKWSQPLFPLFPHLFAMKWWDCMPWS